MLRRWRRGWAGGLVLLATLWAAGILVSPRVVSSGAEHPLWSDSGALVYLVGGLVCHQRPERSFHFSGVQYPVCARCTGLYLAAPLGMLAAIFLLPASLGYRRWRAILLIAILPTAVSIVLEQLGGPSGLGSRFLAAVPLGMAAAAVVMAAVLGHFGHRTGRGNGV